MPGSLLRADVPRVRTLASSASVCGVNFHPAQFPQGWGLLILPVRKSLSTKPHYRHWVSVPGAAGMAALPGGASTGRRSVGGELSVEMGKDYGMIL